MKINKSNIQPFVIFTLPRRTEKKNKRISSFISRKASLENRSSSGRGEEDRYGVAFESRHADTPVTRNFHCSSNLFLAFLQFIRFARNPRLTYAKTHRTPFAAISTAKWRVEIWFRRQTDP